MASIPLLGLLGFYSLFFYGVDVLRGGNDPFLSLVVPGRYVTGKYPTDEAKAQSSASSAATPSTAQQIKNYAPGGKYFP